FGDRVPSDKPPVKTPGELARERGEPWPPEPVVPAGAPRDPAPAKSLPQPAGYPGGAAQPGYGQQPTGYPAPQQPAPAYPRGGTHGSRPDYGAPAGWSAPGWPPRDEPQAPPAERDYGSPGQQQWHGRHPDQHTGGHGGEGPGASQNGGHGESGYGQGEDPGRGGAHSWDGPNGRQ
ncbi:ATP-dependent zinc metalloprotease FtsH, partial [Nocardia sp. NPDC003345]